MLELICESNSHLLDELVQDYEEEFSSITGKKKNEEGKYSLDVDWRSPHSGYYWKEGSTLVGFCIVASIDGYTEIAEFYVIPACRKKRVGRMMAFAVFNHYPGPWQVRQILGAELAKTSWRQVIHEYTNGNYTELQLDDPTWGRVVCQRFKS